MKSIMQEASSVVKAIEQGWIKAGKPQEFSIKILEEAQKNFIGLTTKPAKIALFFDEAPVLRVSEPLKPRPQAPRAPRVAAPSPKPEVREPRVRREEQQPRAQQQQPRTEQDQQYPQRPQQRQLQSLWTEQMVDYTHNWLAQTLHLMDRDSITFTVEPQNFHLRITFSSPILSESDKEKHLLASFSTVIIETLKRQFRTGLRGHKIVLTHA